MEKLSIDELATQLINQLKDAGYDGVFVIADPDTQKCTRGLGTTAGRAGFMLGSSATFFKNHFDEPENFMFVDGFMRGLASKSEVEKVVGD